MLWKFTVLHSSLWGSLGIEDWHCIPLNDLIPLVWQWLYWQVRLSQKEKSLFPDKISKYLNGTENIIGWYKPSPSTCHIFILLNQLRSDQLGIYIVCSERFSKACHSGVLLNYLIQESCHFGLWLTNRCNLVSCYGKVLTSHAMPMQCLVMPCNVMECQVLTSQSQPKLTLFPLKSVTVRQLTIGAEFVFCFFSHITPEAWEAWRHDKTNYASHATKPCYQAMQMGLC